MNKTNIRKFYFELFLSELQYPCAYQSFFEFRSNLTVYIRQNFEIHWANVRLIWPYCINVYFDESPSKQWFIFSMHRKLYHILIFTSKRIYTNIIMRILMILFQGSFRSACDLKRLFFLSSISIFNDIYLQYIYLMITT